MASDDHDNGKEQRGLDRVVDEVEHGIDDLTQALLDLHVRLIRAVLLPTKGLGHYNHAEHRNPTTEERSLVEVVVDPPSEEQTDDRHDVGVLADEPQSQRETH